MENSQTETETHASLDLLSGFKNYRLMILWSKIHRRKFLIFLLHKRIWYKCIEDKYPLLIIHYQLMVPYVMKSYSSSEGLLLSISQEFVSLINFYIEGQRLRGTNSRGTKSSMTCTLLLEYKIISCFLNKLILSLLHVEKTSTSNSYLILKNK